MLLAIEISQRAGSVALRSEHGTVHVEYLAAVEGKVGRHGDDLMPAIDRLFARLDVGPSVMSVVATSIGPGSFTGLRVAITTVKMFAAVWPLKVVAVPSALVAAENFAPKACRNQQIIVALAGKRETFWATRFRRQAGIWSVVAEPGLSDAQSVDLEGVAFVLADEHLPAEARQRCERAGIAVIEPWFDAAACLRVAERLAAAAEFADLLALLPLYPRQPEAVTIWEQRQKKSESTR